MALAIGKKPRMQNKVKTVLMLAILFGLAGGYYVGKSVYTAIVWDKTEGTVAGYERHVWRCGRGHSECYTLQVSFLAAGQPFMTESRVIHDEPRKTIINTRVPVYYSAANPRNARLSGEYGPTDGGVLLLLASLVLFVVYFFSKGKD